MKINREVFTFSVFMVLMCVWMLLGNMLGALFCSVDVIFPFLFVISIVTFGYLGTLALLKRLGFRMPSVWDEVGKSIALWLLLDIGVLGFIFVPHHYVRLLSERYGIEIALGCLFFPVIYSFSDVISEVYGYKASRKVAHVTSFINLVFTLTISLSVLVFTRYFTLESMSIRDTILSLFFREGTLRIVIAGGLSALAGSFLNDIIFRKLQIQDGVFKFGKRRAISSTLAELLDSTMFFFLGFGGVIPLAYIPIHILCNFLVQLVVEMTLLPLTQGLVMHLRYVGTYE